MPNIIYYGGRLCDRFRWVQTQCGHYPSKSPRTGFMGSANQSGCMATSSRGINDNELPEQAMYRELQEKVGLQPENVDILHAPVAGCDIACLVA